MRIELLQGGIIYRPYVELQGFDGKFKYIFGKNCLNYTEAKRILKEMIDNYKHSKIDTIIHNGIGLENVI